MEVFICKYSIYYKRYKGVRIFYSGVTPTLLRAFIANAFLFVTYEYFQKLLSPKSNIN